MSPTSTFAERGAAHSAKVAADLDADVQAMLDRPLPVQELIDQVPSAVFSAATSDGHFVGGWENDGFNYDKFPRGARFVVNGPPAAGAGPVSSGGPSRIELVMSQDKLKFGGSYKSLYGFSLGIPADENSFMHNEYSVSPGIGAAFNEYSTLNGKQIINTRYGMFSDSRGENGGYYLREASKDEIGLMLGTHRAEALAAGKDAMMAGGLSYGLAMGGPLIANGLKSLSNRMINRDGFSIDANKFEYFYGNVDAPALELKSSNPQLYKQLDHNYQRSQQLNRVLESDGFGNTSSGRERLLSLFEMAAKGDELSRHSGSMGTTITRRIETPSVKYEVKFYYENGKFDTVPKVTTLIPKVKK